MRPPHDSLIVAHPPPAGLVGVEENGAQIQYTMSCYLKTCMHFFLFMPFAPLPPLFSPLPFVVLSLSLLLFFIPHNCKEYILSESPFFFVLSSFFFTTSFTSSVCLSVPPPPLSLSFCLSVTLSVVGLCACVCVCVSLSVSLSASLCLHHINLYLNSLSLPKFLFHHLPHDSSSGLDP